MRSLAGQLVEVGRLHNLIASDAQAVGAKLIGKYKKHIAGQIMLLLALTSCSLGQARAAYVVSVAASQVPPARV